MENPATATAQIDAMTVLALELATESCPDWLHWVESCGSTNTWAIEHCASLHQGDVVFTQRQTAGRGQRGRSWFAPPGVITASFVLENIPIKQSGLSLAAGLAVIFAVEDLVPQLVGQLQLKWPNDILIRERKLAGILCESMAGQSDPDLAEISVHRRVVVGVGLNRCADFSQFQSADARSESLYQETRLVPISLHEVASTVPTAIRLLTQIRQYLLQVGALLTQSERSEKVFGLAALLPQIQGRDVLLGRHVSLDLGDAVVSGQSVGIDASGQLLLCLPNHEIRAFTSGRVQWT